MSYSRITWRHQGSSLFYVEISCTFMAKFSEILDPDRKNSKVRQSGGEHAASRSISLLRGAARCGRSVHSTGVHQAARGEARGAAVTVSTKQQGGPRGGTLGRWVWAAPSPPPPPGPGVAAAWLGAAVGRSQVWRAAPWAAASS